MADAYSCLSSLREMLTVRREELKEKMARGVEEQRHYHECVGRCRELLDTIDKINKQIKSLSTGGPDDSPF